MVMWLPIGADMSHKDEDCTVSGQQLMQKTTKKKTSGHVFDDGARETEEAQKPAKKEEKTEATLTEEGAKEELTETDGDHKENTEEDETEEEELEDEELTAKEELTETDGDHEENTEEDETEEEKRVDVLKDVVNDNVEIQELKQAPEENPLSMSEKSANDIHMNKTSVEWFCGGHKAYKCGKGMRLYICQTPDGRYKKEKVWGCPWNYDYMGCAKECAGNMQKGCRSRTMYWGHGYIVAKCES